MTQVRVAQLAPRFGMLEHNTAMVTGCLEQAARDRVDVLVLPELVTSGYVFRTRDEVRGVAITTDHPCFAQWSQALAAHPGMVAVVGFAEREGEELYNSAAVLDAGGLLACYRKAHLWHEERRWFRPGDELPPVVATAHGRLSVVVCYDLGFPEWPRTAALQGADLLAVPTNWPLTPDEPPLGEHDRPVGLTVAAATARANHLVVAFADRSGDERGTSWSEGSGIVAPSGRVLAMAGPGVATASTVVEVDRHKSHGPVRTLDDRRPELYHLVSAPRPR